MTITETKLSPMPNDPRRRDIDLIHESWGPKFYSDTADVTLTRHGADEISFVAPSHFLLVLLTPQPRRSTQLADSRPVCFDAPAGTVEVIPKSADFRASWTVPKENILICIGQEQLNQFAERELEAGQLELSPIKPGTTDRTANRIASLMREEFIQRAPPSRLYLESLMVALMVQMIRGHSSLGDKASGSTFRGGLTPAIWRDLEEYIRTNLASDLTLSQLAAQTNLSYSHFLRAFRQTAGIPPHRFIMHLRAEQAREMAASTSLPLKQVAFACGFSSQSHMTTVMRSILNVTPGDVRNESQAAVPDD